MKKTLIASSAIALTLMTVAPAFADDKGSNRGDLGLHLGGFVRVLAHDKQDNDDQGQDGDKHSATSTVSISGAVTGISGSMLTLSGKNGAVYTVNAANATFTGNQGVTLLSVKLGDKLNVRGALNNGIINATRIDDRMALAAEVKASLSGIALGMVTAISGNTLTILGHGKTGTTTVVTNASTIVRPVGNATTSATVGSRVLVFGTSSTSTPGTITADFIAVIGAGFGHLKHFFGF